MNASDLQKRVDQFKRDSETPVQGAEADFRQKLKEATQRRLAPYQGIEANREATDESFGKKVGDAVKRRTAQRAGTVKQHNEQAERERARYRKPERRQRTKGE
jgi:hypothetical protein